MSALAFELTSLPRRSDVSDSEIQHLNTEISRLRSNARKVENYLSEKITLLSAGRIIELKAQLYDLCAQIQHKERLLQYATSTEPRQTIIE